MSPLAESEDHTKTAGGRGVQVSLWISKSAGANAEHFDSTTMLPALEPSSLCPGPTDWSSWKLGFRNTGSPFIVWRPGVSLVKRKYDRTSYVHM